VRFVQKNHFDTRLCALSQSTKGFILLRVKRGVILAFRSTVAGFDPAGLYGVVLSTVHLWRRRGLLRSHPSDDRGNYLYEIPPEDLPAKYAHKGEYQPEPVGSSQPTSRGAV
jgi:hypothetical protein